jgi:phage terminase large subunit GpA-like protein
MTKYLEQYPDNKLSDPMSVCWHGIMALGRPKRVGPLDISKNVVLPTPLGVERYDINKTPYLTQIMADLNMVNRAWTKVVFCGVQRSGKSQPGELLLWSGIENNVDSLVMFGQQSLARDGSNDGFRRLIKNNPRLRKQMLGGHGNSVYRQKSKAGASITYLWPSEANIRQRTSTITWANDADMLGNLEGKGDVIGLLHARTQTKKSRAMNYVESAAYAPIDIPHDEALDRSEMDIFDAYPSGGVVNLWLQGTRCLWFWKCTSCDEHFHAGPENFHVDIDLPAREAGEKTYVACPHCGQIYDKPAEKYQLNLRGQWLGPGMLPVDELPKNKIRSYRLYGPAAGFMAWDELAMDWTQAWQSAKSTGDKSSLQRAYTSSMGLQWVDPDAKLEDNLKNIESRAEDIEKRQVPNDVHFLITTIDQQKKRFVVQVHGFGRSGEVWLVDRYNVTQSPKRVGEDGKPYTIEPSTYEEDWDALYKVIDREYTTADGAVMKAKLVSVDTGGQDKATENAYRFWKRWILKASDKNVLKLTKGRDTGERIDKSNVVKEKSGVVLHLLNVHRLKDEVEFALNRTEPGPRYVHFPKWLGEWFYDELRAEVKDPKTGKWVKRKEKINNEALDLLAYALAGYTMVGGDTLDYDNPPAWAIRAGDRGQDGSSKSGGGDLDWMKNMAKRLNG